MILAELFNLTRPLHGQLLHGVAQSLHASELERFAAFGRISSNLLHEVTNPLTAAVLNLEQIDTNNQPLVIEVRKNLRQLERYIEAAKAQLKSQSHHTKFSISQELQSVRLVMQPQAQQASVRLVFRTVTGRLYGDPVKFSQIVTNLVANAIDAYAGVTAVTERVVEVTVERQPTVVLVRVSDWGHGITTRHLHRVFQPFYTTKGAGRGTGIGLSLVKQIVEQDFGGDIRVKSSPGQPTVFTVHLRSNGNKFDITKAV